MADADGENRRLVYAEDGRHVYGGHVSPDGKYLLFTGNVHRSVKTTPGTFVSLEPLFSPRTECAFNSAVHNIPPDYLG